jgi:hypothetical protein
MRISQLWKNFWLAKKGSILLAGFSILALSVATGLCFIYANREFILFMDRIALADDEKTLKAIQIYDLYMQIGWTSLIIGTSLTILMVIFKPSVLRWISNESADANKNQKNAIETLLDVVVPVSALIFVLYQIMAGSLFATTTVTAKGDLCREDGKVLVSATLERGGNWLAAIALDQYFLSHDEPKLLGKLENPQSVWKFPRPQSGLLRLAPNEKTSTQFYIPGLNNLNISVLYLTVSVRSYALFWPIPSESLGRAVIPVVSPTNVGECGGK